MTNGAAQWVILLIECPKKLANEYIVHWRGDEAKSTFPGLLAFTYSFVIRRCRQSR